jgi:hypothetical protein
MDSLVGFSMLGPFALTLCVQALVLRPRRTRTTGGGGVAGRTLLAGVGSTALLGVLISTVAGLAVLSTGGTAYYVVAEVICYAIVVGFGLTTIRALRSEPLVRIPVRSLEGVFSVVYPAVFAALWIYAVCFGTPTGSLPYVVGCYAFLSYLMWRCFTWRASAAMAGDLGGQHRRDPAPQISP